MGQTNALLGHPADARLLIVNADDFGMCHAINVATIRAILEGVVTSTSLMVPCPWALHAMQLLKGHPNIPFGVHLTLISEHTAYRWGPVASKDTVPSLLDEAGFFYTDDRRAELLARAKLDEVEREFRAQIAAVVTAQLKPTHLDWHCFGDGGRPDAFDLTLALAREFGLALRIDGQDSAEKARRARLPANDHGVLDSYSVPVAGKAARYAQLLRELPPGLSEWAVHTSLGDAEAQAMEPGSWQVRRTDFEFLISPDARNILAAEGIVLLSYRALQQVSWH
jgi:predicted glycoside hydrolase/deacetylase ChbG (UPF0249 family)